MFIVYSPAQRAHLSVKPCDTKGPCRALDVPERIDSILSAIQGRLGYNVVTPAEFGQEALLAVHHPGMLEYLSTAYSVNVALTGQSAPVLPGDFPPPGQRRRTASFEGIKGFFCTDTSTPIDAHTWQAARASAHCALTGARLLAEGQGLIFALCRPPGHHAGPDFFGGYCYLNNAALAATALSAGGARVAILDTDCHHGNGTQAVFYSSPRVWYGSLHVDPSTDYPHFAGFADEAGEGAGRGLNCNVPLARGSDGATYLRALGDLLERLAAFGPERLVVSAGFDSYALDPVRALRLSAGDFDAMGRCIGELGIPTLVVLEGGYHVHDLGSLVMRFLQGLSVHHH